MSQGGRASGKLLSGQDHGEALRQAARVNDAQKLKELLGKGAEVNAAYIGFTPLRWASLYGHKEAIAILREADARDDLFAAGARGDSDAVEALLAGNADVNQLNRGNETALMWVANGGSTVGHTDCVKLLLKAKAQVHARDQHGFTALMGASQCGHVETMKLLIGARADVNAREAEDDETAIMMAMHCARSDAVQVLVAAGATPPDGTVTNRG